MSALDGLYGRSPVFVQNAMVTGKGLSFRVRRSSDESVRRHLNQLLRTERISVDERRARANERLRAFLSSACSSTPYYRDLVALGTFPEIWRSDDPLAHFGDLPLLDKRRVRGNEQDFYSTDFSERTTSTGFTSGTTGSPMKTRETRESASQRFAFVARLRTWAGLAEPLHPRRAQFTGRAICQEDSPFWRRNLADNAMLFSTVHISERSAAGYVAALERFRPDLVDGYPSAILAVARLASLQGLEVPPVKAVIVTAETLTPAMRDEISTSFGSPVFNQYAASEPSCFWSDCEQGSLHIHEEYGISEILDPEGRPVAPGELGEVVVTSLLNPAMPLIRYRTGDLARSSVDKICSCGRTLRTVAEVIGRTDDILYTAERGFVGRLDPVYKGVTGIVESQIIQETLERIRVLVVPDASAWTDEQQRLLVSNLAAKVGRQQQIEVQIVDQIPRGANGKFRSVVTACRELYPIDMKPY